MRIFSKISDKIGSYSDVNPRIFGFVLFDKHFRLLCTNFESVMGAQTVNRAELAAVAVLQARTRGPLRTYVDSKFVVQPPKTKSIA